MSSILNIAGKLDDETVAIFQEIQTVARELQISFVVVGATARDLVMHYGYGVPIKRATKDIDFAVYVSSWDEFKLLKERLLEAGYLADRQIQRINTAGGIPIDIVPFGGVEGDKSNIAWPPEEDFSMSVLGFSEACNSPDNVVIQETPEVVIPVVSPAGLFLLKLIAWTDRSADVRTKDAEDLGYLLINYESITVIEDRIYQNRGLMEAYDYNQRVVGAYLLGSDVGEIASVDCHAHIKRLVNEDMGSLHLDVLVEEMCSHPEIDFDRYDKLLSAFLDGFNNTSI